MLKPYTRRVNYYETDKMGITHHSNYVRFMEEARLDLMDQVGLDYAAMEEKGIIIPVLDISCKYVYAVHYGDTIVITPKITKLTPVRFSLTYEIRDEKRGEIRCEATSSHAFVDTEFRPMNMKRNFPELYAVLESVVVKDE